MKTVALTNIFLKKDFFLPAAILILIIIFFVSLHPASGGLGGFVFLLTGWAIPSAINILLATWFVSFFRVHWITRICLFFCFSFFLGVNIRIASIFSHRPIQKISYTIVHTINYTSRIAMDDRLTPTEVPTTTESPVYAYPPSVMGVGVGGDEGCMCMYFVYRGHLDYYTTIQRDIRSLSHKFSVFDSTKRPNVVNFDVTFRKLPDINNEIGFTFNVYDGPQRAATFSEDGLPTLVISPTDMKRGASLSSNNFYRYTSSMLIHRNFWMYLVDSTYEFDDTPLRQFLSEVFVRNNLSNSN